jgi:hypothetical protein
MTIERLFCGVSLAMSGRRRALGAMLVVTVAGCLPTGAAPTGQHLLSDRALTGVHFSPSETEGVPSHLLVTGPAETIGSPVSFTVADLYQIPADTALGGYRLDQARLLTEKCLVPRSDASDFEVRTDIRGRLLVTALFSYPGTANQEFPMFDVFRIDLASGIPNSLGSAATMAQSSTFGLSPGRTRVLDGDNYGDVWDLDGGYSSLCESPNDVTFVGEDVYYDCGIPPLYQTPDLWRLVPNGETELLAHNARLVNIVATDQGPRLILDRPLATANAPAEERYLLFDPSTLATTPLPSLGYAPIPNYVYASPDGHWLILVTDKLTLFNWVTSETQQLGDLSDFQPFSWEWRPGRSELWLPMADGTLRLWKPETGLTTAPTTALPVGNYQAPTGTWSSFTRDGNYWFSSQVVAPGARPALSIGPADDPAAPTFPITPAGAHVNSHWELADGRVMVGVWTASEYRKNYYLVDPRTGAAQAFALNGALAALGHARLLAYVNWQVSTGASDLCLIDLATGAQTLLAQNVYAADVDPGTHADVVPGTDPLAPGTRVAYLVRERLDSPYDGLWITELP